MRLLDSTTFEFIDSEEAPTGYAILSHRWYQDCEEVTYEEMRNGAGSNKLGYEKIRKCGEIARAAGHLYFWIDTCCIDKTSSAELSEAINSMYSWYRDAATCYAFLFDVSSSSGCSGLRESKWFSRGWTLQELLAPSQVEFLSKEWESMGTKLDLKEEINQITGIPIEALHGESFDQYSVAEKMSWAARRQTKRVEDRSYCLMGLFGVNMPLLYGEKDKAFLRLQEEIMKISDDQSLFAWADPQLPSERHVGLLASGPEMFKSSKDIYSMGVWHNGDAFSSSNKGIGLRLFLIPHLKSEKIYRASLECWVRTSRSTSPAIYVKRLSGGNEDWGTSFGAQFARIQGSHMDFISGEQKHGGIYRAVFIRQNPGAPQSQLRDWSNSLLRHFRIMSPKLYHNPENQAPELAVFPPNCWDPQMSIFTALEKSGKFGRIRFGWDGFDVFLYFGLSTSNSPWVKLIERPPRGDLRQAYTTKGDETSDSIIVRENRLWRANVTNTNMYGIMLYVISIQDW